jgi:hypothetical protein
VCVRVRPQSTSLGSAPTYECTNNVQTDILSLLIAKLFRNDRCPSRSTRIADVTYVRCPHQVAPTHIYGGHIGMSPKDDRTSGTARTAFQNSFVDHPCASTTLRVARYNIKIPLRVQSTLEEMSTPLQQTYDHHPIRQREPSIVDPSSHNPGPLWLSHHYELRSSRVPEPIPEVVSLLLLGS